ncbi:MAG: hypothetical protein PHP22_08740 [Oscillospiraceae bacterium]|nr:hypothetical protein [Oscillospiraceae bacterium]
MEAFVDGTSPENMPDIVEKGKLLGQGRTAEIFEWGPNRVLKLCRQEMPESICIREFEWTSRIYEHVKVAPKPIEMICVEGRSGAVYERLIGETVLALTRRKPWQPVRLGKSDAGMSFVVVIPMA